jgi:hypothetical protein
MTTELDKAFSAPKTNLVSEGRSLAIQDFRHFHKIIIAACDRHPDAPEGLAQAIYDAIVDVAAVAHTLNLIEKAANVKA